MSEGITIQIAGLAELEENLKQLPDKIVKKVFSKALRASGSVLKDEIVNRIPVKTDEAGPNGNSLPPGAVKAGVQSRVKVIPENGGGYVSVTPSKNTTHVMRWIEYGHEITGHKPGKKKSGKNVPAKPCFRTAVDAVGQKAIDAFAESLAASFDGIGETKS